MTEMPLSDANIDLDLLRRVRAGDASAMSALYARHQAPLFRFAVLRAGSADTAADVVQDVFVALIEGKLAFDPMRGALSSFLYGVARNFILKRDEAARRFLPHHPVDGEEDEEIGIIDPSPTPLEHLLNSQRAERIRAALLQLAPHYRDVLILYEMQELSYVEIAEICHIDIGTVRSRLSRARAKIIQLLQADNLNIACQETPKNNQDQTNQRSANK